MCLLFCRHWARHTHIFFMQSSQQLNDTSVLLSEDLQNSPREKGKSGCGALSLWIQLNCAKNYHSVMWVSLLPFLRRYSMHVWDESVWYLSSTFGQGVLVRCSGGRTRVRLANRHSRRHCVQIWRKERSQRYSESTVAHPWHEDSRAWIAHCFLLKGICWAWLFGKLLLIFIWDQRHRGLQVMSWHRQGRFPFLKLRKRLKDWQSPVLAARVCGTTCLGK